MSKVIRTYSNESDVTSYEFKRSPNAAFETISQADLFSNGALLGDVKSYLARTTLIGKSTSEISKMGASVVWKTLTTKAYALTVAGHRGDTSSPVAQMFDMQTVGMSADEIQTGVDIILRKAGQHLSAGTMERNFKLRNREVADLWGNGTAVVTFDPKAGTASFDVGNDLSFDDLGDLSDKPAARENEPVEGDNRLFQTQLSAQKSLIRSLEGKIDQQRALISGLRTTSDQASRALVLQAEEITSLKADARDFAVAVANLENSQPKPPLLVQLGDVAVPAVTIDGYHSALPDILKMLAAGVNVFLKGPSGCGKTHLAKQCAEALQRPFFFTGAISSEFKLLGYMDANGRFIETDFYRAYTTGGLFLWDEIDASRSEALMSFNAALANDMMDFPNGTQPRHPDFVCIAAANTFGQGADRVYVGREQLDGATLDRFSVVEMDYDTKVEERLTDNVDWVLYVWKVRAAVNQLNLRHIVSSRAIINGARLLSLDIERAAVEKAVLWKGLDSASIARVKGVM